MGANLRTRLRALVEEWREDVRDKGLSRSTRSSVHYCAETLAALLDETEEPEACSEWRHCEHDGEDGHVACDVLCADCGMRLEAHPPKPLPLDHAFTSMMGDRCEAFLLEAHGRYHQCDQPREAHE